MISKYGLSREMVHFQDTLDTHLPLITSSDDHLLINDQLDTLSTKFKEKIGKFLQHKALSKQYYKKHKNINFCGCELELVILFYLAI